MSDYKQVRTALISVSDKTGIDQLGRALHKLGVKILSTGGTARLLEQAGVPVTSVSDYTGFPEIMGGRVKTLQPKIHGGLLGRRGIDEQVMTEHGIEPIDLLVVNLYPFVETISKQNCSLEDAIENIDIGGPAMLRAAAKNWADVGVLVNPEDYAEVLEQIENHQGLNNQLRLKLATRAFTHTSVYDAAISRYLNQQVGLDILPEQLGLGLNIDQRLRYGENPHQQAASYAMGQPHQGQLLNATQVQGKPLSYNNMADADSAWECVWAMGSAPCCVIVKHANPCGVALGDNLSLAYQRAFDCDPESAFGGIIAFNQPLDAELAQKIINQQFVEVIIAPNLGQGAAEVLSSKKNIRVLTPGILETNPQRLEVKVISGGMLVQGADQQDVDASELKCVSKKELTDNTLNDMLFAWKVAKFVKSNAIVYARDGQTLGIGAGQMSRVMSARIAALKAQQAGFDIKGAVMASDAFFPFRDGIDAAAERGIASVIQPGGSIRDEEVISAADEHGMVMAFTAMRHFRH